MKRPCPHCGQFKLESRWVKPTTNFAMIALIGIPLSIVLIGFFMIPFGIIGAVVTMLTVKGKKCRNCGWTTTDSIY